MNVNKRRRCRKKEMRRVKITCYLYIRFLIYHRLFFIFVVFCFCFKCNIYFVCALSFEILGTFCLIRNNDNNKSIQCEFQYRCRFVMTVYSATTSSIRVRVCLHTNMLTFARLPARPLTRACVRACMRMSVSASLHSPATILLSNT